uniref:Uncharacterized protein n=1 Tax=Anguilla anguilla TaxID=7936 RepID=A0A0E9SUR2_ANGAN
MLQLHMYAFDTEIPLCLYVSRKCLFCIVHGAFPLCGMLQMKQIFSRKSFFNLISGERNPLAAWIHFCLQHFSD